MSDDTPRIIEELLSLREQVTTLSSEMSAIRSRLSEIRNLVGPFGTPFPDGTILVQTIHMVKYFVDANDMIMTPNLIVYRQWEPDISALIINNVHQDTIFVDVGANIGYFSCLAASRIGNKGSGRVFSIEPNPACQALLRRNLLVNWSMAPVSVFEAASGRETGIAKLSVPVSRAANASLAVMTTSEAVKTYTVEVQPLSKLLPVGTPVDLVKIDVEGFEFDVLSGARAVIERSPDIHLVMEWSQDQMRDAGYSVTDMLDLISDLGLSTFEVPPSFKLVDLRMHHLPPTELTNRRYCNLILARDTDKN